MHDTYTTHLHSKCRHGTYIARHASGRLPRRCESTRQQRIVIATWLDNVSAFSAPTCRRCPHDSTYSSRIVRSDHCVRVRQLGKPTLSPDSMSTLPRSSATDSYRTASEPLAPAARVAVGQFAMPHVHGSNMRQAIPCSRALISGCSYSSRHAMKLAARILQVALDSLAAHIAHGLHMPSDMPTPVMRHSQKVRSPSGGHFIGVLTSSCTRLH